MQIQTAIDAAASITGISQASEAVVTATHDYSVGDLVVIDGVSGMTKINNRVVRVSAVTGTSDFTCQGLDTTGFNAWVSGGSARKVSSYDSFDNITQISLPDAPPDEIDITTVHDDEKNIVFGHEGAQKGTLSLIANPLNPAVIEVQKASTAQTRRVFLVTLQSGVVAIFNAFCAGGSGFDGGVAAAGTAQIALTLRTKPQWFAS